MLRAENQDRVLVLAPTEADAALTESILREANLSCHLCSNLAAMARAIEDGAGALLLTDEALAQFELESLAATLRAQPAWSDLPILVLCNSRAGATRLAETSEALGNVTTLERPVRVANLLSALRSALRARHRQYEIHGQIIALAGAEQQLREADRRKNEFLAILAHELRNPLGPVRNAAHVLKQWAPVEPELARPIEMIDRQVAQMARLIDDLLDVSRMTRGLLELRRERLDFREVVRAAVEACRDEVAARHHRLHVAMPAQPLMLEADFDRLVQAVSNLIGNAAKYTHPGGQLEVRAEAHGSTLEVRIKDNGIGIPHEKLGEIFELFAQVDRTFDRQGGLGIGLTLVRQLIGLHGGTIEASSPGRGGGSEFLVRLPLATGAIPAKTLAKAPPASNPQRILVADDSRDAAESLALMLELSGHEVRQALDGEAAIRAAEEFLPNTAILDLGMPKLDGYEVARRIRSQPWGKGIRLIALTGWGQETVGRRAKEAGFDTHLVKPVAPEALIQALAETSPEPGTILAHDPRPLTSS